MRLNNPNMVSRTLSLLLLFFIFLAQSQILEGVVIESGTKIPLNNVRVQVENSEIWTLTDQSGKFRINLSDGETLTFSRTNLIEKKVQYKDLPRRQVAIEMDVSSARIPEVTISIQRKRYSEIEIKEEALKNIQAFSLNEVLEQLPGQKLTNLNLNEFKPIVFRSATPSTVSNEGFGNKSFGTSIVVDGIPISNNENMQTYNTNYSSVFSPNSIGFGVATGRNGYFSNANFGADLREISIDNIEKIEVVQGVASAKYGDMTSGMINITEKKGRTPYRFYAAFRDGTQEYNFNKGFLISEKAGFLNFNLNYMDSNTDPRSKFNVFTRWNSRVNWTWQNAAKNFENSLAVEYSNNFDDANFDEEDTNLQITYNKKRNFRISNRLKWGFKNKFFDNLNVNLSYSNGYQFTHDSRIVNVGGDVVGTSIVEGVYTGVYTPVSYRQTKEIEGKPISAFGSIDLSKKFKTSEWIHNFSVGTTMSVSDNKGAGRLGSPETLQNTFGFGAGGGGTAFRPYNFGDNVIAEYQLGVYAEDNIFRKFENTLFNASIGMRADYQNENFSLAPRINSYLVYKDFKFRAGFGISTKAPSLNMIYTGPRYFDAVLADVRLPGYYNVGVVQTFIDAPNNADLKPSKGVRSEIGADYKFKGGNVSITAYYNQISDGFTSENYAQKRDLATIEFNYNGTEVPTYEITGYKDFYFVRSRTINALQSSDRGIEVLSSLQKLPIRNLSLDLQGNYVKTITNNGTDRFFRSTAADSEEVYGLYKPYDNTYEQLNASAALNYHLPKAGLIISVRSQHYFIDSNSFTNPNKPYAYINRDLEKVLLTEAQINDPTQFANIKSGNINEVETNLDKVFHNLNLRITKDFTNGFSFSFYSNNFLDLKQTETIYVNGSYQRRPKADLLNLSFGAKIEYQF